MSQDTNKRAGTLLGWEAVAARGGKEAGGAQWGQATGRGTTASGLHRRPGVLRWGWSPPSGGARQEDRSQPGWGESYGTLPEGDVKDLNQDRGDGGTRKCIYGGQVLEGAKSGMP